MPPTLYFRSNYRLFGRLAEREWRAVSQFKRGIPVLRPRLATADELLPYLRRIDQTRSYSNFGPLSEELQQRLGGLFEIDEGGVACTNSGTSALMAAILAATSLKNQRQLAIIPALTFAATAAAAERCGYKPHFVDVDSDTWLLDPQYVRNHPKINEVGVVIPVAAYGKAVGQKPWIDFMRQTGIPVVIDGAASFQQISTRPQEFLGSIPVAISFHATKSFGTGEGGCVVWVSQASKELLYGSLNFGFYGSRLSRISGNYALNKQRINRYLW